MEVAAGKEWVVPHIETAWEEVVRKLRESTKPPKAKEVAALEKLGKGVKMTRGELDEEMTMKCLKAYLDWKKVTYPSKVKKAEIVDTVFAAMEAAMEATSADVEEAAAEEVGFRGCQS